MSTFAAHRSAYDLKELILEHAAFFKPSPGNLDGPRSIIYARAPEPDYDGNYDGKYLYSAVVVIKEPSRMLFVNPEITGPSVLGELPQLFGGALADTEMGALANLLHRVMEYVYHAPSKDGEKYEG